MIRGSAKKGIIVFCLTAIAFSIRAEIMPTSTGTMELARAVFDTDALESNGLDPVIADYYSLASRFTPGIHNVTVIINGKKHSVMSVKFNEEGQPCIDKAFLESAGLVTKIKRETCPLIHQYWSTATVSATPETEEMSLVVPQEAIDPDNNRQVADVRGGHAAMLNYSMFGTHYKYDGDNSDRFQSTFELGFNAGDWIVRSTQFVSDGSDQELETDSYYTYAQRTFADYGVMVQGGQINIANSRFSIPSVYGVQVMPDNTLLPNEGSGVEVTGIARYSQARVDIRQGGQIIYSTLVPAGPFTLTDVPIANLNTDLNVTVTETDGSESHFTVSASTFRSNHVGRAPGFSLAVGRAEDMDTNFEQPWIVSASDGWSVNNRMNLMAGMVMADNHYYGFSANVDTVPVQNLYASLGFLGSIDNRSQTDGHKTTLDLGYSLPWGMGISLGGSYGTADYREMQELYSDDDDYSPTKYDTNVAVSWSDTLLGRFSLGYYRNEAWDSDYNSRRIISSWSQTYKYFSVSVNWESDISRGDESDRDMFYVNVSVPLGRTGVSTNSWYRESEGRSSYGTRAMGSLNDDNQYTVGVSRDQDESVTDWDSSLNSNLHYTTLSVAAGGDNDSNTNYSAALSGGIVAHDDGVTFSPYPVADTYAITQLDKPVAGIEIVTSRGPVWTDKWGQAVVPSLTPFHESTLELNTQSLPGNLDVNNGRTAIKASHGAVAKWQFTTLSQRRVLLSVMRADGTPLPKGVSIVNDAGEYITSAPEDGLIFLNDISASHQLYAKVDGGRCKLNYTLPEADPQKFYEEIKGKCL
ncbi:fimbrial biogenesis outer membrane usher protein [Citrobacter koseri]|uniref:fimbrial biogenesis outer membrane usher protein n=1 Tax=Citrobacter koseri TaxID=545 RepID=UPI001B9E8761|nr:fimbrial biogenesis outer membrane usher protein [Citrobacter koseri]MEB2706301.1 fimbrial biogenesis outer membrane usher protein [Citrobacter koseri]MEB2710712.1 fimbrial biogenesis outer membrane usher protein [Citrobacter koseri]MEB2773411.1 fimbrial biogenesis outer membrane usher protein [Citrobacter koseri]WOJ26143.1 fimbrial biogenesis outer membrane usher protein [Citrobacter koseri]HBC9093302.1 fimbrial biogenesis outer membrane usher protein [Citrobacter koseri]